MNDATIDRLRLLAEFAEANRLREQTNRGRKGLINEYQQDIDALSDAADRLDEQRAKLARVETELVAESKRLDYVIDNLATWWPTRESIDKELNHQEESS